MLLAALRSATVLLLAPPIEAPRGSPVRSGRVARAVGGDGDGMQVEYLDNAGAGGGSDREAWMVGGSDNAQAVHASPRQRRRQRSKPPAVCSGRLLKKATDPHIVGLDR
jgi:hypothetical protein